MENYNTTYDTFLQLLRLGIGHTDKSGFKFQDPGFKSVDWVQLKTLADAQGLSAVVLDGLDSLNTNGLNGTNDLPLEMKLEWIGEVLQGESVYAHQRAVAADMANLFYNNAIRPYVLKGNVISECYPKPHHRVSVDIDCFLLPDKGDFDAWFLGNDLIRAKGFTVNTDFYKNSSFDISGVNVENHQYLTPFRGNARLMSLEKLLQAYLSQDKGENVIEGTHLYRPPVMVTALFLIEHAYSHFLHEGLTWRMVLDWVMFKKKHETEIEWASFEAYVDEFGFRKFYDVFNAIGMETFNDNENDNIGSQSSKSLKNQSENLSNATLATDSKHSTINSKLKSLMISDIWAPLDVHDTIRGWKGKLALAGNTWRARWKYRYFTDMNWMQALWIQVKGFLFEKEPKLN